MKLLWILLIAFISVHANNEIQRVDTILKDIKQLRQQYEASQETVAQYKRKLQDEQEKNSLLLQEIEASNKTDEIKVLKNIIHKQKKLLATKEKPSKIKQLIVSKCKEDNSFPKLIMKKEFTLSDEIVEKFDAKAFRLKRTAPIYEALHGEIIDTWEEGVSFTSNARTKNMIKITGYFVNKVWQKASQNMWLKSEDAFAR